MNKISIRGILLRISIAFATVVASACPSLAQYESLNPKSWFPLQEGNAWAYATDFDTWIYVSTRDTVAYGMTWRLFDEVECFGPSCGIVSRDRWYAFDANDYLVRSTTLARIDTVIYSSPTSIFRTAVPIDTVLNVRCPADYEWTGSVTITENGPGARIDSTNLVLAASDPIIYCDRGRFAYKIGYLGANEPILTGAIVNGREWGEVEDLRRVLGVDANPSAASGIHLSIYPQPIRTMANLQVSVD